jgi:thioester reductase-like protein
VREAVVLAREDVPGDRRLVAYVVPADPPGPALRSFLKSKLPQAMIPSAFVGLDALPLTPSGKIDRRALPAPGALRPALEAAFAPPEGPVEQALAAIWAELLGADRVGVHDDFFDLGGHSVMVAQVVFRLQDALGVELPIRALYETPTIAGLARSLEQEQRGDVDARRGSPPLRFEEEAILDAAIDPSGLPPARALDPAHVLLTGATGFVGAFLLAELAATTSARIHCLIRARDREEGLQRLRRSLAKYDLWSEALTSRIEPVLGDLSSERLGLSPAAFAELAGTIDVIYHNGAWVDHVRSYRDLRPANVAGTHEVLRLACLARLKPVHFISTLASVHPERFRASGVIREDDLPGPLEGLLNGYMEAKSVAEHLLFLARDRGLPMAIYRLGAVSGHSRTGVSNPRDFTHSVLLTALQLGVLDDVDADVLLTPVDFVAQAIVALSGRAASLGRVFHITNPQSFCWSDVAEALRRRGYPVQIIPYADLMKTLVSRARQGIEDPLTAFLPVLLQRAPGTTRYQFEEYYFPVRYDCTGTLEGLAGTGIACPPIDDRLLDHYLAHLAREGLTPAPSPADDGS